MSDIPTKTYPPSFLRAMIADHEAEQAGATPEASSVVETKGDAMSEKAHDTTETQGAVNVSDHGGVLLRISRGGLWVNPDIPADECAQRVLESLRPILSHTINTEVNIQVARLTAERDEAREKLTRVQVQYDEFAKVTAKVIDNHQRETNHARQQVYLLQQAGANRPSDEDIWREAFMAHLSSAKASVQRASKDADIDLAEYRKRWPR